MQVFRDNQDGPLLTMEMGMEMEMEMKKREYQVEVSTFRLSALWARRALAGIRLPLSLAVKFPDGGHNFWSHRIAVSRSE